MPELFGQDAQMIALALAGIFSPFLTMVIKKLVGGVEGMAAFWVSAVVAGAFSTLVIFAVGGFSDIPGLPGVIDPVKITYWSLMKITSVFGLGQLIYKALRPTVTNL